MKKIAFFIPAVFYYVLIFSLSSTSLKIGLSSTLLEKGAHFVEFAIMGVLLSLGFFNNLKTGLKTKALISVITGSIVSISDEIHQYFVPDRVSDYLDAAADIGGVILGTFLFLVFFKIYTEKNNY